MSAIRHLFTLAAALMIHAAVPAAAQINDASRMVTTLGSSEVSSGTWQRLGDDRSQRDERHPSPLTDVRSLSLLRDVAGDYARFFTTWENYLILELGLMGSVGLKALTSRFEVAASTQHCGSIEGPRWTMHLSLARSSAVRLSRWVVRLQPTASGSGLENPGRRGARPRPREGPTPKFNGRPHSTSKAYGRSGTA